MACRREKTGHSRDGQNEVLNIHDGRSGNLERECRRERASHSLRTTCQSSNKLALSFTPTKLGNTFVTNDGDENSKTIRTKTTRISMGTLNIRDGRSGNLEMACRRLQDLNMDIVMVTETKLSHGKHTSLSYGYEVYGTNCNNTNLGGVAILV